MGRLERQHAPPLRAFADEQLNALTGVVAQPCQRRPRQLDEREPLVGDPAEGRQLRPQVEATLVVASQQPVRLEGHGEPVGGRPWQTGRRLDGAEGGRPVGNGAQDLDRLVDHADTRYSVHIAGQYIPDHEI